MSNPQRLPTFMKISNNWMAQAKDEKVLGSFVANNVCRDIEGSLRIPAPFIAEFGSTMPYYLQLRCNNIMWHATFEQERKKICGLYDFFRYYDLRMYSLVIFYYIGKGIFHVNGYTHNAIEAQQTDQDVVDFWKNFDQGQMRFDEFVYGRNHVEIERYIGISSMGGMNQTIDVFKIEIDGVSNLSEDAYLELKIENSELYNGWMDKQNIYLCPGMKFWEISVTVVGGVCRLGHGWYKFVTDFGIADGDVLLLTATDESTVVNVCMLRKDDVAAEKKAGEKNDKRSFYKIIVESAIEDGYLVLPPLLGEKTEKNLLSVRKLKLYNMEFKIRYNSQKRIIYGLEKVVSHFVLRKFDVIFFRIDKEGELVGIIFRTDGMEYPVSEAGKSGEEFKYKDSFLFEETNPNSRLDFADAKILDVQRQSPLPKPEANMTHLVDSEDDPQVQIVDEPEEEVQVVDEAVEDAEVVDMEIEEEVPAMQFSRNLNASNMNGRCHGMHIPHDITIPNRAWEHGDDVSFITAEGTWNLGIVMNHGTARFSRGWSRFVRENRLVQNQLIRYTLRQDGDHPVFDVDFP